MTQKIKLSFKKLILYLFGKKNWSDLTSEFTT